MINIIKNKILAIFMLIFVFIISSCTKDGGGFAPSTAVPEAPVSGVLSITPAINSLAINSSFNFVAAGGVAPYNFSILSGGGTIITLVDQGSFTAPAAASTALLMPI
jgi:hypothetical protein